MEGLKRIAEELQAMRPAMAEMADKLAHYDMQKFLVTLNSTGQTGGDCRSYGYSTLNKV